MISFLKIFATNIENIKTKNIKNKVILESISLIVIQFMHLFALIKCNNFDKNIALLLIKSFETIYISY
jgi:hypothetical protein